MAVGQSIPTSTYRVQLRPEFGFDELTAVVPYLARLGVSHVYTSPILQAGPGSEHGYDVVDHSSISTELGGMEAYRRFIAAAHEAGLGHVLDIVPNHMAIPGRQNAWWWDVLANGQSSPWARYFDIDWEPSNSRDPGTVLLPVLGRRYGQVLAAGELTAALDANHDEFVLRYFDSAFPLSLLSLEAVAETTGIDLHAAGGRARMADELAVINQDTDRLDDLVRGQHYRLAYWRLAEDELDYRRFFDINSLVGLHAENNDVFMASHRLVLQLVEEGCVDGLRVDHVDGLRDPAGYLRRLREHVDNHWIVVEKILEPGERLPASWPVAGTTGYDALDQIDGLFVEPSAVEAFDRLFVDLTEAEGQPTKWEDVVAQAKTHIVEHVLRSDVERIARLVYVATDSSRSARDYTLNQVRTAVRAFLVSLDVYRTYVVPNGGQVTHVDISWIDRALESARRTNPDVETDLLEYLRSVLTLERTGDLEGVIVDRMQQTSSPVMAKGVEDTAFYRYLRFAARNEVGTDPSVFARRPDDFHEWSADVARSMPATLLASTTHDTKRNEDVRWRMAALSQLPEQWSAAIARWHKLSERHRQSREPANASDASEWPDPATEYLLYQTLIGAYPLTADRAQQYMTKATKEAKRYTSWTEPNPAFDDGLKRFIEALTADTEFMADFEHFAGPVVAKGRINALAATLLKLTMPGVPDVYQGTELWNLSLVDPDNRRPVDFAERLRLLEQLERGMSPEDVMAAVDSGLPKLHVMRMALRARRDYAECFAAGGNYLPVWCTGERRANVVAFVRSSGSAAVVTVVPRLTTLPYPHTNHDEWAWGDTVLELSDLSAGGQWHNLLTNELIADGAVSVEHLLRRFPVALLGKRVQ